IPNVIGRWFPRRDDPDIQPLYCASMLALLTPWWNLTELIQPNESWERAFDKFMATASKRIHDIIAGIQYYYDCGDSA
ncbi:hypothetical protein JB92DRAFT_2554870, partial [Gautieria morchelliformis]